MAAGSDATPAPRPAVASPVASPDDPLADNAFLAGLLGDLRAARFRPLAWVRFLVRSWERSLEDARTYPALVAATWRSTLWLLVVAGLWLAPLVMTVPAGRAVHAVAIVLAGLAVQQGFVWLHLGMVQPLGGGPRLPRLGLANGLTLLRLLACWLLLAYAVAGVDRRDVLLGVFLMGALTDGIDGGVARRWETPTRMGRMLDGIADTLLFGAGAVVFAARGLLPGWFALLVVLRFLLPFAWALVSYFLQLRPVRYTPTRWGKAAGAAVVLSMLVALLDPRLSAGRLNLGQAVLVTTGMLLVAAVVVQFWSEHRRWRVDRAMRR